MALHLLRAEFESYVEHSSYLLLLLLCEIEGSLKRLNSIVTGQRREKNELERSFWNDADTAFDRHVNSGT